MLLQLFYMIVIHIVDKTMADDVLNDWFNDNDGVHEECRGGDIVLGPGEATILWSHRGYGRTSYPSHYYCGWTVKPRQCDLSLQCKVTLGQRRWGTRRRCEGEDYLRVMKGGGDGIGYHQKYCAEDSVSLKFSGDDFVKVVFQSFDKLENTKDNSGAECKIVCHKHTENNDDKPEKNEDDNACECGDNAVASRIICPDSKNCTSPPVPWQVGLRYRGADKPFCGGTLVSNSWVLTAAHCLQREDGRRKRMKNLEMVVGEYDWSQDHDTEVHRTGVEGFWIHPDFSYSNYDHDIALVRLARSVDISHTPLIRPACLPSPGEEYTGYTATVTGWGRSNTQGDQIIKVLRGVQVKVMDNKVCQEMYVKGGQEVTDSMLCAMTPGADACQGDSGGPLTVSGVVVGVVSWGVGCAEPEWPGVYSRVTESLTWIHQIMEQFSNYPCYDS